MRPYHRVLKMIYTILTFSFLIGCNSTPPTPWYFIGGGDYQHGTIIDSVEQNGDSIAISFWRFEESGFIMEDHVQFDKRYFDVPLLATPTPLERQNRIEDWKRRGYTARITDLQSNTNEVSNVLIHYYPPSGYQYVGAQYKVGTNLAINSGGTLKTVHFNEISDLVVKSNEFLFTLRDGSKLSGVYSPETYSMNNDLSFDANIYGIQYGLDGSLKSFEIPIANVGSIVFLSSPEK